MKRVLSFLILLALVAAVASASCWLTRRYIQPSPPPAADGEVFAQLDLTPEQERKINVIREQFNTSRQHCALLMNQRNRELAAVILSDKADSPRVQAAVEQIHEAMGDMQKATLNSIFAARDVLTTEQYGRLLRLVAEQLSAGAEHPCCR
ncbi:MAG: periplasmic heavy metal sensor [Verrucomicrobiales bacterium]|jgi:Spy/CpxP family protein refolding chaperone|nr:periplasmic heavy metal sensor [Verrucomicrobiales bacterium]